MHHDVAITRVVTRLEITFAYNSCREKMLSGPEVRNKVADDMAEAEIFDDKAYTFKEEIKALPTAVVTAKGTVITIPNQPQMKGESGAR